MAVRRGAAASRYDVHPERLSACMCARWPCAHAHAKPMPELIPCSLHPCISLLPLFRWGAGGRDLQQHQRGSEGVPGPGQEVHGLSGEAVRGVGVWGRCSRQHIRQRQWHSQAGTQVLQCRQPPTLAWRRRGFCCSQLASQLATGAHSVLELALHSTARPPPAGPRGRQLLCGPQLCCLLRWLLCVHL